MYNKYQLTILAIIDDEFLVFPSVGTSFCARFSSNQIKSKRNSAFMAPLASALMPRQSARTYVKPQ